MKKRRIVPLFLLFLQLTLEFYFTYYVFLHQNIHSLKIKQLSIPEKIWFISFFYALWSFISSAFLDPGIIRDNSYEYSQEFDDYGEKLYCSECGIRRPPRAHHCKTCGYCIALKDHHCYYLGNCIGLRNYRSFFVFLISFLIHSLLSLYISWVSLHHISEFSREKIISIIIFCYFLFFSFSTLKQIVPQISFIKHNSTWIESSKDKSRRKYSKTKQTVSRYDTGSLFQNMKQRFGPKPLLWIFPIPNNTIITSYPQNPEYIPWNELDIIKEDSEPRMHPSKPHQRNVPIL